MKTAKTLLALALTLALATLALPAFAETDPPDEPGPAIIEITIQDNSDAPEQAKSFWETIWRNYIAGPIMHGFGYALVSVVWTFGLLLPIAPILFLIGWAIGLFTQPYAGA